MSLSTTRSRPKTVEAAPAAARRARVIRRLTPYLFIAPALLVLLVFSLGPFVHGIWLSFYQWDGISPGTWVGAGNYRSLWHDATVRRSFLNAGMLLCFSALVPLGIALLVAGGLRRVRLRGLTAYRTLIFLPFVLPGVVTAIIWHWLLGDPGPVNRLLSAVGLGSLTRPWLADFTSALPTLGLVAAWSVLGVPVALFIAGAQKIPVSLYDAARVDGAGAWRELQAVTLPGLRNEIVAATVLLVTWVLKMFELIFLLTAGGPGTDTTTMPGFELYRIAFENEAVGLGAALATVLTVIIFVITVLITRLEDRQP
ncbi:carbohydrate ABC transporter permease [Streptomyces sp. NPDC004752]